MSSLYFRPYAVPITSPLPPTTNPLSLSRCTRMDGLSPRKTTSWAILTPGNRAGALRPQIDTNRPMPLMRDVRVTNLFCLYVYLLLLCTHSCGVLFLWPNCYDYYTQKQLTSHLDFAVAQVCWFSRYILLHPLPCCVPVCSFYIGC